MFKYTVSKSLRHFKFLQVLSFIVIFSFVLASPARAEQWVQVGYSGYVSVFIDKNSMRTDLDTNFMYVWGKYEKKPYVFPKIDKIRDLPKYRPTHYFSFALMNAFYNHFKRAAHNRENEEYREKQEKKQWMERAKIVDYVDEIVPFDRKYVLYALNCPLQRMGEKKIEITRENGRNETPVDLENYAIKFYNVNPATFEGFILAFACPYRASPPPPPPPPPPVYESRGYRQANSNSHNAWDIAGIIIKFISLFL